MCSSDLPVTFFWPRAEKMAVSDGPEGSIPVRSVRPPNLPTRGTPRFHVFSFTCEGANVYATLDVSTGPAKLSVEGPTRSWIVAGGRPVSESPETRLSLLVRLRDVGDRQAWTEFVDLYAPLVYRLGRRCGLQDADAADLTQEALSVAAAALPRFRYDAERGSFRGWLLAVARHLVGRLQRVRHKQPSGSGDPAVQSLLDQQPAPDESEQWEREYRQRLFECAAERVRGHFRSNTWDAFWRTAVGGEEADDVAASLGMSVGAVYIARTRVLARVREAVRLLEGD